MYVYMYIYTLYLCIHISFKKIYMYALLFIFKDEINIYIIVISSIVH